MQMYTPQSKEQWDNWIINNTTHHQFPQSWEWGEILQTESKRVERFVFAQDSIVRAQVQTVSVPLIFGWVYGFCPKGPVLTPDYAGGILSQFQDFFVKNKVVFARAEPNYPMVNVNKFCLVPTLDVNPRATLILDLSKDENRLFEEMHQKTRYNIRLAQKKNLKVVVEKNEHEFLKLMKQTAHRDGFKLHPEKHYHAILQSNISRQVTVYDNNRAVAVGIFIGFGDTFTYLFGASDHNYRALMGPYLIQWEGIKLGQSLGYRYYDFFGIAPGKRNLAGEYEYDRRHQYGGVTRFKLGFGGDVVISVGTIDVVASMWRYRLYGWLRRVRRLF